MGHTKKKYFLKIKPFIFQYRSQLKTYMAEKIATEFGLNLSGSDLQGSDLFFTVRTLSKAGRVLYSPKLSPGGPLEALTFPDQVTLS